MMTPSGFRIKLLFASVFAIVFVSAFFRIADLDFWWHLKTGQIILETATVPDHEIYSFTANGREYIDHEWLFQVILYLLYSAAGPSGGIAGK